ncbi:unnamed protein product [Eruca vesicaria subsp. sativa]|uniref:Uncharacterized protein n=1 Tax=Eruca vesicaria subsp. sativa TaxID=29727 RepID=A0ABC8K5V0_ERUVS|nr:unnamed protein product [Eruca vesicaria subsp. sativa]
MSRLSLPLSVAWLPRISDQLRQRVFDSALMSVSPPLPPATTSKPTQLKPSPSCRRSSPLSILTIDLPLEPPDPPDMPARAPPPPPLLVSNASPVPPLVTTHHGTSRNVEAVWSCISTTPPSLHVSSVPSPYAGPARRASHQSGRLGHKILEGIFFFSFCIY